MTERHFAAQLEISWSSKLWKLHTDFAECAERRRRKLIINFSFCGFRESWKWTLLSRHASFCFLLLEQGNQSCVLMSSFHKSSSIGWISEVDWPCLWRETTREHLAQTSVGGLTKLFPGHVLKCLYLFQIHTLQKGCGSPQHSFLRAKLRWLPDPSPRILPDLCGFVVSVMNHNSGENGAGNETHFDGCSLFTSSYKPSIEIRCTSFESVV